MQKYFVKSSQNSLAGNPITHKGVSVLLKTLKECKSVVLTINLSRCAIEEFTRSYITTTALGDECMKSFGEYIQDNPHLKSLLLCECSITDDGVEILSEYLIGNTTLDMLDLSDNEGITAKSVPTLKELARKSCLTELYVWGTSIPNEVQKIVDNAFDTPTDQREIPIKSNTKSAAKTF